MGSWAAVIGDPIDHSLSPVLHREAYRLLGLDWQYNAITVPAANLAGYLESLDDSCRGLSITQPLKHEAASCADVLGAVSKATSVCNTLIPVGALLAGENTDVSGITSTLRDYESEYTLGKSNALIFGSGATASSAVVSCQEMGYANITVVARNFSGIPGVLSTASSLFIPIQTMLWTHTVQVESLLDNADLVISTVPDHAMNWTANKLDGKALLEVSYGATHNFAAQFQQKDGRVISPLRMLVHQGIAQIKLMTGHDVPFDSLYTSVTEAAGRLQFGW